MSGTTDYKQCQRWNIPGHAHFLTFSCFQRQPFLLHPLTRKWTIEALAQAVIRHQLHLWAWVIMPEHVHLVIYPKNHEYSIPAILQSIKQPVSQRFITYARKEASDLLPRMANTTARGNLNYAFWQRGGGYDRNLYSAAESHEKIHYVHHNPVNRGLVTRPEEWEFSSARDRLQLRSPPLICLDRSRLPPFPSFTHREHHLTWPYKKM